MKFPFVGFLFSICMHQIKRCAFLFSGNGSEDVIESDSFSQSSNQTRLVSSTEVSCNIVTSHSHTTRNLRQIVQKNSLF